MQYMLMIHGDEQGWAALSQDEQNAVREEYGRFAQRARESGKLISGAELQPSDRATTVRVQNGETLLTDGPYAETRDPLGGYFLVEADSIDEAVDLAKGLPAPGSRGAVEVWPVYEDESEAS